MNCRYFACQKCFTYVDAGYRWAYWALEATGVTCLAEPISVAKVIAAEKYWHVDDDSESTLLRDRVLPGVRLFLGEHRNHEILYVEEDWLHERWELGYEWHEDQAATRYPTERGDHK